MSGEERAVSVAVAGGRITVIELLNDGAEWVFAYAPGAGANINDPFGKHICRALSDRGASTVRFQFPYQETGRRSPDRPAVLKDTWRAVIQYARSFGGQLVVGGRSMGGRIASQVVAAGEFVDRLALFAYPLHPPGKPEQTRDAHLPSLNVPVLFVSGTRDAFASPQEIESAAAKAPGSTLHLLEGADHGFNVPKSSGRIRADVWQEATDAAIRWLEI